MDKEEIKAMNAALEDLSDEYRQIYTDNHIFIHIDAEEASTTDQEDLSET